MKLVVKKSLTLAHEAFLSLVCILLLWCANPISTPSKTFSDLPPDAAVSDCFTGFVADCNELLIGDRTAKAAFWVQSCMDLEGETDKCMVKGAEVYTKDALVCLLIDMNVRWVKEISEGVSNPQTIVNSANANRWIRNHQVGARK